ncbi:MAG: bifunctional serine/threonine-protein kinase/formylglycine-generating enzyme family protein [Planctomycetota bacterium]
MTLGLPPDLWKQLPHPLAQICIRVHNAKNPVEKHSQVLHLFEAAVKLAVATQVAVYLRAGPQASSGDERMHELLGHLASPSYGHWVALLRELSERIAALEPNPLPELAGVGALLREESTKLPHTRAVLDALRAGGHGAPPSRRGRTRFFDLFDALPTYRNRSVFGHGALRHDRDYAALTPLFAAAAQELFKRVPLFGDATLVFVAEVRRTDAGPTSADLWDLTGPVPLRWTLVDGPEELHEPGLRPGRLYLKHETGFLDLHPLVLCQERPPDGNVLFLNRSTKGKPQYLDYATGVVHDLKELAADHRLILGTLVGHELSNDEVDELCAKSLADQSEPAPQPDPPEARRFGDFLLLGKLGAGGMGRVYLAKQPSLGRLVALKLLPPALSDDEAHELRFQRETYALALADHPNVVRILQRGRTGDQPWYAMEYVDGSVLSAVADDLSSTPRSSLSGASLDDAVRSASKRQRGELRSLFEALDGLPNAEPRPAPRELTKGPGFDQRLAALFRGAAEGLAYLHARGVVHRDVKPGNVMVTRHDGRAVIMDLGLARVEDLTQLTGDREGLGTIRYAAPEQLVAGHEVDERADVYGLGATLYEVATGRRPYDGEGKEVQALRAAGDPPTRPRKLDRGVSPELEAIILKATAGDPARRYGSAQELADDLGRLERGEPVLAPIPGWVYPVAHFVRRYRAAAVATLVVTISLIVGFVVSLTMYLKAQRNLEFYDVAAEWVLFVDARAELEGLWPFTPETVLRLQDWRRRAGELASKGELYFTTLDEVRARSEDRQESQGTDRFLVRILSELVDYHSELTAAGGQRARVDRLLAVHEQTIVDSRTDWRKVAEQIAKSPKYGGLQLKPQFGLIPLETNPNPQGYFEFAYPLTGDNPTRGDDGQLRIEEGTCMIFVLLPGGQCQVGVQHENPDQPNFDKLMEYQDEGPPHEVRFSPFFVSKYEMTQGQWLRVTGDNPSFFRAKKEDFGVVASLAHPVEMVSWKRCSTVLTANGLELPTEAQWEYAARGFATEFLTWTTGNEPGDLCGAGNFSTAETLAVGQAWEGETLAGCTPHEDDGYVGTAPVGSFRPNGFGLHDIHGNVWEWCRDRVFPYPTDPAEPRDGDQVGADPDSTDYIFRGAGFPNGASKARCAYRSQEGGHYTNDAVGVRPIRVVDDVEW